MTDLSLYNVLIVFVSASLMALPTIWALAPLMRDQRLRTWGWGIACLLPLFSLVLYGFLGRPELAGL